jgi:hypothetical protein
MKMTYNSRDAYTFLDKYKTIKIAMLNLNLST